MPLDLLVPDNVFSLRGTRLPALEKWLARADHETSPSRGRTRVLAALFGVPEPAPVAAIEIRDSGSWLRADPVHLRIDQDYLRLHDAADLGITADEAHALAASLQAHFAQDGLEFRVEAPDRWYARVPQGEAPTTTPLADAVGHDIFGLLPTAGGRINWRSAITEAQMVLAAHEVNAQREASGKPAINSVWFWGEGAAPASIARRYSLVHAGDPFARGLAELSGARLRDPVARLSDVDLDDAVLVATVPADAQWLDANWFSSLGTAIDRFGSVRLILPGGEATRVATLTPASRWRWFRSRKPLAAYA